MTEASITSPPTSRPTRSFWALAIAIVVLGIAVVGGPLPVALREVSD